MESERREAETHKEFQYRKSTYISRMPTKLSSSKSINIERVFSTHFRHRIATIFEWKCKTDILYRSLRAISRHIITYSLELVWDYWVVGVFCNYREKFWGPTAGPWCPGAARRGQRVLAPAADRLLSCSNFFRLTSRCSDQRHRYLHFSPYCLHWEEIREGKE